MHFLRTAYAFVLEHGLSLAALAGALVLVWKFYRNEDLREHSKPLLFALALLIHAPLVAWLVWVVTGNRYAAVAACIFLVFGLLWLLTKILNRAFNDYLGGLIFDLVFSEGPFALIAAPERKLPNLKLLQHWREAGLVGKAYRRARRGLEDRKEALPIWLFAMETAAVHRKDMPAAIGMLRRLCACKLIEDDQKEFAFHQLKGWAALQGGHLPFRLSRNRCAPTRPLASLTEVSRLVDRGDYDAAESVLARIIGDEPENLAASVMLVRLHGQYRHDREKAERVLDQLAKQPFTPEAMVEYLRRSIEEWFSPGALAPEGPPKAETPLAPPGSRKHTPVRITLEAPAICRPANAAPDSSNPDTAAPGKPVEITQGLSATVANLVADGRLGTAVEELEARVRQDPRNLETLLELAQVHILNCDTLKPAERIFNRIELDPRFDPDAKEMARSKLKEWRNQYAKSHPMRTF
jgi:hypothetical protein